MRRTIVSAQSKSCRLAANEHSEGISTTDLSIHGEHVQIITSTGHAFTLSASCHCYNLSREGKRRSDIDAKKTTDRSLTKHLHGCWLRDCFFLSSACRVPGKRSVPFHLPVTSMPTENTTRQRQRSSILFSMHCRWQHDYITETIIGDDLQWLPAKQRLVYKLCNFVYKCFRQRTPSYLPSVCGRIGDIDMVDVIFVRQPA